MKSRQARKIAKLWLTRGHWIRLDDVLRKSGRKKLKPTKDRLGGFRWKPRTLNKALDIHMRFPRENTSNMAWTYPLDRTQYALQASERK